jgi:NNP family nitrate/nitrite transporter-like MFS transporter
MVSVWRALRSGHWPSLLGAWLHFEVSFIVWLLIGALGVSIAEEFALTATEKGFLVAIPLLGGALLRVVVGLSSDRLGPKRTGVALLVGELLALLWGWQGGTSYEELLGMGLCLGFAGASFAVALPLASRAYPPAHQGLAMGIAASGNSGTVLAVFFAPRIAQSIGWHAVFGLMVGPVLVTLLLFVMLVRESGVARQGEHSPTWARALADTLRCPSMYWFCFVYGVTFGGFVGLCSFAPILFHDRYGLDLVTAGSVAALCGLAGSLIRPLGGYLADRLDALPILVALFAGVAVLVALFGQTESVGWAVPLIVATVALLGCGNGVIFRLVSERFQPQIGLASGLIGAAGGIGGFLLPSWLGLLKDATGTYLSGFLLLAGLSVGAALSVAMAIQRGWRGTRSVPRVESVPR